ncbi:MAG: hypothetical protein FJY95_04135 [Candidatus Handelsmanbacteria bacterium]|nr:hypothetical protein [Candidatus Handelsmanbacteria bacterium]
MLKRKTSVGILAVLAGVWLAGCEKPPVAEQQAAQSSVEDARKAEGPKYAGKEFNTLQDSLKTANTEIETQNNKFALFRNYTQAKGTLGWVSTNGPKVAQKARDTKEQLRKEAEAELAAAQTAVDTAAAKVAAAPRSKDSKEEIQMLESEVEVMRNNLQNVKNAIQAENFPEATSQAKAITGQATQTQAEVQAILDKVAEAKAKRRGKK